MSKRHSKQYINASYLNEKKNSVITKPQTPSVMQRSSFSINNSEEIETNLHRNSKFEKKDSSKFKKFLSTKA